MSSSISGRSAGCAEYNIEYAQMLPEPQGLVMQGGSAAEGVLLLYIAWASQSPIALHERPSRRLIEIQISPPFSPEPAIVP